VLRVRVRVKARVRVRIRGRGRVNGKAHTSILIRFNKIPQKKEKKV
jgi:hypothetical protein